MIKALLVDNDDVINLRQAFFGPILESKFEMKFIQGDYDRCMVGKADLESFFRKEIISEWVKVENGPQNQQILEIVDSFRGKGGKAYLASDQEKYRAMDSWEKVGEHFDGHFFSFEVGYLKVDPGYWQNILPQLGVKAEEIAFVDDNPANIEAAEKFGILGEVYNLGSDLRKLIRDLSKS